MIWWKHLAQIKQVVIFQMKNGENEWTSMCCALEPFVSFSSSALAIQQVGVCPLGRRQNESLMEKLNAYQGRQEILIMGFSTLSIACHVITLLSHQFILPFSWTYPYTHVHIHTKLEHIIRILRNFCSIEIHRKYCKSCGKTVSSSQQPK